MFLCHVRIHIKQIAMTNAQIAVINFRIDCNDNLTSCLSAQLIDEHCNLNYHVDELFAPNCDQD